MSSNYETLYGVGLLDDLHNYFPALLYDPSLFSSVQDVLRYIQTQSRSRFDLFSYGSREYQASNPPPMHRTVRTYFNSVTPPSTSVTSTLLNTPPHIPSIQVELTQNDGSDADEEEEPPVNHLITNALLQLLQLPSGSLTRNYRQGPSPMDQFLQPVPVRPTEAQIQANTTLGNLVSDTEHTCAICQDALTSEQEGRKLNACGHWFHRGCIDTWFSTNVHCPVCRHDIRESTETSSSSSSS